MHSPIKRFAIKGLFGDRNVSLDFPTNVAIIVDPNGSGKTTFMRAMVCILRRRWHHLAEINFESAVVEFHNNKKLEIERSSFLEKLDMLPFENRLRSIFSIAELEQMYEVSRFSHSEDHPLFRRAADVLGMHPGQIRSSLRHGLRQQRKLFESETEEEVFSEYDEILDESFPLELVYFPTYRRVERALAVEEERHGWDDMSIHYGMGDVKGRIGRITQQIKESFVESYAETSGQMLSQLIDGIHVEESDIRELAESEYIEIVLERLGENISKADRENLLQLIRSNEIEKPQYKPLVYFVNNLMSVYRKQREKDDSIKLFAKVVNSYFSDKEIKYNESKVDIWIENLRSKKPVDWKHLSSGEKQIASIFSRLHLTEDRECAIFFDEPELSLSIEWQRQLLADIAASKSCKFLFAATHSPFVYENDLDCFATSLVSSFVESNDE